MLEAEGGRGLSTPEPKRDTTTLLLLVLDDEAVE